MAVIFGDLHAGLYKNIADRLDIACEVLREIFEFASSDDGVILFVGDLYDRDKLIPTVVVNAVLGQFKKLFRKYREIEFYAISGNHDQVGINTWENPVPTALSHLATVFDRFTLLDNQSIEIVDGLMLHGIPYYKYREDFQNACGKINRRIERFDDLQHIVMTHQGYPNIMDNVTVNAKLADVSKRAFVLNGHLHKMKKINARALNVGSPLYRDRGDLGQKKGFFSANLLELSKTFPNFEVLSYYDDRLEDFAVADKAKADIVESLGSVDLSPLKLLYRYADKVGLDAEKKAVGVELLMAVL